MSIIESRTSKGSVNMEIVNGAPQLGQKVELYVNLQRNGLFSIVDRSGSKSATNGKVLAYVSSATLTNAAAKISDYKYNFIHDNKRRTVCAVFIGTLESVEAAHPADLHTAVHYNPYRRKDFHTAAGETVTAAPSIHFCNRLGYIAGTAAAPTDAAAADKE
jgi:hypothetical protein